MQSKDQVLCSNILDAQQSAPKNTVLHPAVVSALK